MSSQRRLGRGLEALLGQAPPRGAAVPAQYHPHPDTPYGTPEEPYGPAVAPPPSAALAGPGAPAAQPDQGASSARAPGEPADSSREPAAPASLQPPAAGPARLPIALIDGNPAQPRQEFDSEETGSLAESLSEHGLLQPIVVRRAGEGRYQLIAGERRLRAARQAGWTEVPAQIIEADDRRVAELAIVENLQRRDLNPLEKAASFQRYLEQYGCTQEELASRLKMDRSTIANLIRLLELPEAVRQALREGRITQGHARALLPLGDEREQIDFCRRIEREGLNVRQTEAMVQDMIAAADAEPLDASKPARRPATQTDHVAELEQQFRAALGLKVQLTHTARGRGKLVVHFRNHEEFERLREHVCGPQYSEAHRRAG